MYKKYQGLTISVVVLLLSFPAPGATKKQSQSPAGKGEITGSGPAVLWRNPSDIASRNLFYGPGGQKHRPRGTFTFTKEDLDGSNPKFVVRDQDDVKWKVKLGQEARPETVASRLVWAVGYFANEDYFLPAVRVEEMPRRLHRGQNLVGPDGSMKNVRLKRYLKGEKKIGQWEWRHDPFTGTRELNGLRVMMALINNWDLKDENNAVYEEEGHAGGPERIYMVSDLGASFGTTGFSWTQAMSKGNLNSYSHSKFIGKVTPQYVDFNVPTRPALIHLFVTPQFISRLRLRWIGRHIPRADALWMGQLLARLSEGQIRDSFRSAEYSPQEVEEFTKAVRDRIAQLNRL